MADSFGIVILAAGKGTRLKMDVPKALCPIQGRTLVDCVLENLRKFENLAGIKAETSLVVGHRKEEVQQAVSEKWQNVSFAWQKEQKGTAHALQTYFEQINGAWKKDFTLVVCADTPLITEEEYTKLYETFSSSKELEAVAAVFETPNPFGYGRIVQGDKGFSIIEEKDASEAVRKITTVNSGLYLFKTKHIKIHLDSVDDSNKAGEFYLTDLFKEDYSVRPVTFENAWRFLGINNLVQLEEAAKILQKEKIQSLQLSGVRFVNSGSCYIEENVKIGAGSVVYPNVVMEGNVEIEENCLVEAGVVLKNCGLQKGAKVFANSYIENAQVGESAKVGPMARIRPGSKIGSDCKIGNFVETKNAKLDKNVSVSHLSYVGDAQVGEGTNLGCGFITCNYDGAKKHQTVIGKNCFIGSDTQMIAPLTVGDEVYVASGSTINKDLPSGSFGIARQRQTTKEGMAKRFIKKK